MGYTNNIFIYFINLTMFELKVRVKSHWLLFYNGVEVRSGSKIFIRKWLNKFYPETDYKNLKVTKYRNGDSIPEVTYNSTWAGLTTGAWCYYDNDSGNL